MSQIIIITLSAAGLGTGPYDIYSNSDGYTTPVATAIPQSILASGYYVTVPDSATAVRVQSVNSTCSNYVDISIPVARFISTWRTTHAAQQITLPLSSYGGYAFYVDWGDGGGEDYITQWNQFETTHIYSQPGNYQISIRGIIEGIGWGMSYNQDNLISIQYWGPLRLGNEGSYFANCTNLDLSIVADALDLTGTTNFNSIFYNCQSLTTIANVNSWHTSQITDMSYAFSDCIKYDDNLSGWNTYSVTNMSNMFARAGSYGAFYGNVTTWNTHRVTDMSYMFNDATVFNNNIGSWITDKVTNMSYMFTQAAGFSQDISAWNVHRVTNMSYMFANAISFNATIDVWQSGTSTLRNVTTMTHMFAGALSFDRSIGIWDVSRVTDMSSMFASATTFNQDISTWNISSVTDMNNMFANATAFDGLLNGWNTVSVTDMSSMFRGATQFNQPINNWNVSSATTMASMLQSATAFNQSLSNWERPGSTLRNVATMESMFKYATAFNGAVNSWNLTNNLTTKGMFFNAVNFNQPVNNWDLTNNIDASYMFFAATAFNQDISQWDVTSITTFQGFMDGKTFTNYSSAHYDSLLDSWASQPVQLGIIANFGTIKYDAGSTGDYGRTRLINDYLWQLTDGGVI